MGPHPLPCPADPWTGDPPRIPDSDGLRRLAFAWRQGERISIFAWSHLCSFHYHPRSRSLAPNGGDRRSVWGRPVARSAALMQDACGIPILLTADVRRDPRCLRLASHGVTRRGRPRLRIPVDPEEDREASPVSRGPRGLLL